MEEKLDAIKSNMCGFGTTLMIVFILFMVIALPSKSEIRDIVQTEMSKAK